MSDKLIKINKIFGDFSQSYSDVLNIGYFQTEDGVEISTDNIYFMQQIHTDDVVVLEDILENKTVLLKNNTLPNCDGVITAISGVYLAVRTADCFPLLVYDSTKNVIAAVHSGRDSTKLKIIQMIIQIMIKRFQCNPIDIKIEIGAGICENCYEVSDDIALDYYRIGDFQSPPCTDGVPPSKYINGETPLVQSNRLNLKKNIIDTALSNGILSTNITSNDICTYESKQHFSFRRGDIDPRQLSLIGMSKSTQPVGNAFIRSV